MDPQDKQAGSFTPFADKHVKLREIGKASIRFLVLVFFLLLLSSLPFLVGLCLCAWELKNTRGKLAHRDKKDAGANFSSD